MRDQVFLDTETTGIDVGAGHRVIEIGATVVRNGMHTGEEYHQLLNPEREIDEAASKVHGFLLADLEDKPLFQDVVEDFVGFIQGKQVLMHNAAFDVRFLDAEFERIGRDERMSSVAEVIDTMKLAKETHKTGQINLDVLCNRYSVDRSGRDKHGALLDAQLLSEVYLRMLESRNSLLGDFEDKVEQIFFEPTLLDRPRSKKLVIKATEEQLATHEAYMERLVTKLP